MRILLVWELGTSLGNLGPLSALGRELHARGHEPTFALRSLRNAEGLLGRFGFPYVQAPLCSEAHGEESPPLNYSEILDRSGFHDPAGLFCIAKAWRELVRLTGPDAIVLGHAPSALLATRGLGIPRVLFGTGFSSPPREYPFPSLWPWVSIPEGHLRRSDDRVLDCINKVLARLAQPPVHQPCDLFADVEEDLLCTFPELDHYPDRKESHYYGPAFAHDVGLDLNWRGSRGRRIFGYLHSDTPNLERVLSQLKAFEHEFIWFIPGLPAGLRQKYETPEFKFTDELCNLARVAQQSDAAITNGGHCATAAFLLEGVPSLMLPRRIEQFVVARNVSRLGAGLAIEHPAPDANYAPALKRLTENDACTAAAEAFAQKYFRFDSREQLAETAARIEALA
jgi:UDP:flavonoid glycosyltransferase YjiC (YdhE family)